MTEDPTNKSEKIPKPLSEISTDEALFIGEYNALALSGVLMRENAITVRMFQSITGEMTIAFAFAELKDSFILGFPAQIVSYSVDDIRVKILAPVALVRKYKNNIEFSYIPPPKLMMAYLTSTRPLLKAVPGFFNSTRLSQIDTLNTVLKEAIGVNEAKVTLVKNNNVHPVSSKSSQTFNQEYDFVEPSLEKKSKYRKH